MKKTTLGLILVVILASSFLGWYMYSRYMEPSRQREFPDVKITGLSVDQPHTVVWGNVSWSFNATVQNFENKSIANVTLEVSANNTETGGVFWNYTTHFDMLETGETRVVDGNASTNMDAFFAYTEGNVSYNATLVLDTVILHEWSEREPRHTG
jgi:hypothetical protein